MKTGLPWSDHTHMHFTYPIAHCHFLKSRIFAFPRHFPALKSDWPLSFTTVTRHFELQYFAHSPLSTSANFLAFRIFVEISDGVQFTPQHDCSTFIHLNFADYVFGGTEKNALVAWELHHITSQQWANSQIRYWNFASFNLLVPISACPVFIDTG